MAYVKMNYQPGDVLTAAQVNQIQAALLESENHAKNKENPHGVTAEQVGAAPAGYGLGEKCITVSSWDEATKNGFYHCEGWSGYVTAHAAGDISQECFGQMSGKMYKRFRWYCDGSWKEWEWVNPPMQVGVEYRTTERWNGRPVYCKNVYFGALPNNGQLTAEHGISNMDKVIRCSTYGNGTSMIATNWSAVSDIGVDNSLIYITTKDNASWAAVYVQLWYVKN